MIHKDLTMVTLLILVVFVLGTDHVYSSKRFMVEKTVLNHQEWEQSHELPDSSQIIPLTFAFEQRNTDKLEALLKEVSDPTHPKYGKYLSNDEITKLVQPDRKNLEQFSKFLEPFDIPSEHIQWSGNMDFCTIHVPIFQAEHILDTKFYRYSHSNAGKDYIRSNSSYSLPFPLHGFVQFVGGVHRLPSMSSLISTPFTPLSILARSPQITPQTMRDIYNIPTQLQQIKKSSKRINSQAVAEFLEEYYSPADLEKYFEKYNISQPAQVYQTTGPNNESHPGFEGSLDIQVILGVAPSVRTWYMSYGGRRDPNSKPSDMNQEPFLDWMIHLTTLSDEQVPLVHSVSYAEDEFMLSNEFMNRLNVEFMKAGVRGLTILVASGDSGCLGSNRGKDTCLTTSPEFPSSSPFVTSVGGTFLPNGKDEVVADRNKGAVISSGGGFSNLSPRPEYQTNAIERYLLKTESVPQTMNFSSHGRGYPDISAAAHNFPIVVGGRTYSIGGTSASTPLVAGIVSLLNQVRLERGDAPMGFINPWLYQIAVSHPEAFNDVVEGNNGCYYGRCCGGFSATPGWDASTGLGTPNVEKLASLV